MNNKRTNTEIKREQFEARFKLFGKKHSKILIINNLEQRKALKVYKKYLFKQEGKGNCYPHTVT